MKDPQDILNALHQFTGTQTWFRYGPIFPNVLLTEGAKFVADECEAYWLITAICSWLPMVPAEENFVLAKFVCKDNAGTLTLTDDEPANTTYATQEILFTDFPLETIKFYVIRDGVHWVILLPSEY